LELSEKLKAFKGWEDVHVILTYGWLCRGHFTDYRVFSVRTKFN
jgi:hypothetical protein